MVFTSSPWDDPTARLRRARICAGLGCSFFLIRERTNQESGLKGLMPLRNPQNLFLSLSFGGYQKACWHLQLLRNKIQRFCCCYKQIVFAANLFGIGCVTVSKSVRFCLLRVPFVFASFFNLQTQGLNLFAFAPQSAKTAFSRGAPRGSKGRAP